MNNSGKKGRSTSKQPMRVPRWDRGGLVGKRKTGSATLRKSRWRAGNLEGKLVALTDRRGDGRTKKLRVLNEKRDKEGKACQS